MAIARTLALSGVLVAAAGWTVWRLTQGTQVQQLLATRPVSLSWTKPESTPASQQADLAALKSGPLMYPARAFYSAPPQPLVVAPPVPSYRLAGTLMAPGKPKRALLQSISDGTSRRVKEGDDLDGWKVQVVEVNRVTLTHGAQQTEIARASQSGGGGLVRASLATRGAPATVPENGAAGNGGSSEGRLLASGAGASSGSRSTGPLFIKPRPYQTGKP